MIIHECKLPPHKNTRILNVPASYDCNIYTMIRIIKNLKNIKYETANNGTTVADQFKYAMDEFQDKSFNFRITHPMTNALCNTLSTTLSPLSYWMGIKLDPAIDHFELVITLPISPMNASRKNILEALNLDQVGGIAFSFTKRITSTVLTLIFDSLNDYKKLKLIGTLDRIQEHYAHSSIVLPRSYMEYLTFTDSIEVRYHKILR